MRADMYKLILLAAAMLLLLAGCTSLAPDYQRPEMPVPQQFSLSHNALAPTGKDIQLSGWRSFFTDPQAQRLINQAINNNRDLQMAGLNLQLARANLSLTESERYPQLEASAEGRYRGGVKPESDAVREYQVGLDLSFALDFFGKLKNLSEAERQNFFASQQARRAAHILLVSEVSQSLFSQRLAYQQLIIARTMLRNYRQSSALIGQQLIRGTTTLLALEQAQGMVASSQAEIARREGELASASHRLQRLVGDYSLQPDNKLSSDKAINPVKLPANLSSQILLQRPDIMQAEHQLKAANANIGAARAAFFPAVSLTGELAASSSGFAALFNSASGIWQLAPGIELPIFNAGRNQARLTLAEINQQQSVVSYQQTVQNAFQQVADVLALRTHLAGQLAGQQAYLQSLQITLQRAQGLYGSGSVSYLDVLDAERTLYSTQQQIADLQYARQINEINLFTALGGGWAE